MKIITDEIRILYLALYDYFMRLNDWEDSYSYARKLVKGFK